MNCLDDRVAIVTGGGSGFGAGIATAFAHEGARVLVADLHAGNAQQVCDTIQRSGGTAQPYTVDVTDADAIVAMTAHCVALWDGLDILVANAGVGQRPTPLHETTAADFELQFAVNVRGVFNCCVAAIPHLQHSESGCIIVTASGIALRPRPNLVAYGASKAAALSIAKGLALELAAQGIRVNALCPGPGDTPMLAEFMGGTESAAGREAFRSNLPLGQLISPEDIGAAAVFLADGQAAARLTGIALPVDSGRTI